MEPAHLDWQTPGQFQAPWQLDQHPLVRSLDGSCYLSAALLVQGWGSLQRALIDLLGMMATLVVRGPSLWLPAQWKTKWERECLTVKRMGRQWWGFPVDSVVKNLPANAEDMGSITGWGRSTREGNGNPLQYSHLENPMDRGAWWAAVLGVAKSRTWLERLNKVTTLIQTCCPVELKCPLTWAASAWRGSGYQVTILFLGHLKPSATGLTCNFVRFDHSWGYSMSSKSIQNHFEKAPMDVAGFLLLAKGTPL